MSLTWHEWAAYWDNEMVWMWYPQNLTLHLPEFQPVPKTYLYRVWVTPQGHLDVYVAMDMPDQELRLMRLSLWWELLLIRHHAQTQSLTWIKEWLCATDETYFWSHVQVAGKPLTDCLQAAWRQEPPKTWHPELINDLAQLTTRLTTSWPIESLWFCHEQQRKWEKFYIQRQLRLDQFHRLFHRQNLWLASDYCPKGAYCDYHRGT